MMNARLLEVFLILQCAHVLYVSSQLAPIVYTNLGRISGRQYVSPGGTRVNGYLTVPYADAPVRFGRPVAKRPWNDVS